VIGAAGSAAAVPIEIGEVVKVSAAAPTRQEIAA
jgi:hypothetical protein